MLEYDCRKKSKIYFYWSSMRHDFHLLDHSKASRRELLIQGFTRFFPFFQFNLDLRGNTYGFNSWRETSMYCKIPSINNCTKREMYEKIHKILVYSWRVLGLTFVLNILHSILKLKEEVITLPSWFPVRRCKEEGKLIFITSIKVITSMQKRPLST